MKNQENVSKEYYLKGYIYLALSSQKSIALFLGKVENLKIYGRISNTVNRQKIY